MTRQRSPSYPSVPLNQAVDLVAKIHRTCRTNIISREDAAREMGYAGLTGRSLKVLSALLQFGLLEKAGKGDVRVTRRSVEILHGIEQSDRDEAKLEAALAPQLFRDVHDRFPDGIPAESAIRSFLIKQDFQDVAIGPAINAFLETYRWVEDIRGSESHGDAAEDGPESAAHAIRPDDAIMQHTATSPSYVGRTLPTTPPQPTIVEAVGRAGSSRDLVPNEVYLDFRGSREVFVEGLLDYDGILDLEEKLKAVKMLLKPKSPLAKPADDGGSGDN